MSVEYSNAFNGFAKGYCIVVAASGDQNITTPSLIKAKRFFPAAYVKQAEVYVGCMH